MEIKQQTLKLINELAVADEIKQSLTAQLQNSGLNEALIEQISKIIDGEESAYLAKAEADIESFKQKFQTIKVELRDLEKKTKMEQKTARQKTDQEAITEIRKTLNS